MPNSVSRTANILSQVSAALLCPRRSQHFSSTSDTKAEATRSRRSLPAVKNGTRFAGMETDVPVVGLRPSRGRRSRNRKLPKPRNSTCSPRRSTSMMLVRNTARRTSVCFCGNWTCAAHPRDQFRSCHLSSALWKGTWFGLDHRVGHFCRLSMMAGAHRHPFPLVFRCFCLA